MEEKPCRWVVKDGDKCFRRSENREILDSRKNTKAKGKEVQDMYPIRQEKLNYTKGCGR